MKILFCTPAPLTKTLGAAKVVVELAEEMRELGWECDLLSIKDLADGTGQSLAESLRRHLHAHAAGYDVVDYDHEYLPYPRAEFAPETLFVARSVLLAHHLDTIPLPEPAGAKAMLGRLLRGRARRHQRQERVRAAQATVEQADLVNVSNDDDRTELLRRGIDAAKIIVLPYGISRTRRPLFDAVSSQPPPRPTVAFVGTFDYRKGAREFPEIVRRVAEAIPDVRFKLLGTRGLFQTESAVRGHFPSHLQSHLEIIPTYPSDELPHLLSDCSVGIFPSHMEGFGFGVLEMLAASLPVVAYDAPGPPMMLPAEYLVTRGDAEALGSKVVALLDNHVQLSAARTWAKSRSRQFEWAQAARTTYELYSRELYSRELCS